MSSPRNLFANEDRRALLLDGGDGFLVVVTLADRSVLPLVDADIVAGDLAIL